MYFIYKIFLSFPYSHIEFYHSLPWQFSLINIQGKRGNKNKRVTPFVIFCNIANIANPCFESRIILSSRSRPHPATCVLFPWPATCFWDLDPNPATFTLLSIFLFIHFTVVPHPFHSSSSIPRILTLFSSYPLPLIILPILP